MPASAAMSLSVPSGATACKRWSDAPTYQKRPAAAVDARYVEAPLANACLPSIVPSSRTKSTVTPSISCSTNTVWAGNGVEVGDPVGVDDDAGEVVVVLPHP